MNKQEQKYRMMMFLENFKKIKSHQKTEKYVLEINKFSDLSQDQFRNMYTMTFPMKDLPVQSIDNDQLKQQIENQNMLKSKLLGSVYKDQLNSLSPPLLLQQSILNKSPSIFLNKLHSFQSTTQIRHLQQKPLISIDWTQYSGSIRSQGQCGACYAFATADAVSSINAIYHYKIFLPLSVKQIIDCNRNKLTDGCRGGYLQGAYLYIKQNGLLPEFKYPYLQTQSQCPGNIKGQHKIVKFKKLEKSCDLLIEELKRKPVAVGIAGFRLMFYKQGVFDNCNLFIDHAALLIGYQSGVGWKCKNSWGHNWGMNGYFWLAEGNQCGICENAVTVVTDLEQKSNN